MKYAIALLATLFALPALAHGPKVSVNVEPTSGIVNTGDRYSVMLDFDLVAELGDSSIGDLGDVDLTNVAPGKTLQYSSGNGGEWLPTNGFFFNNSSYKVYYVGNTAYSFGVGEGQSTDCKGTLQFCLDQDTGGLYLNTKSGTAPGFYVDGSPGDFRATVTFASGDTTPSVGSFANIFMTTGSHSITAFDDGVDGQVFTLYSNGGTTLVDSIGLFLDGSTNFSMGAGDTCTFVYLGTANRWIETGRMER